MNPLIGVTVSLSATVNTYSMGNTVHSFQQFNGVRRHIYVPVVATAYRLCLIQKVKDQDRGSY